MAPNKKPRNKPIIIYGQPRIKPIKKANLTSPKPIAIPLEKNQIKKKNKEAPIAERKYKTTSLKYISPAKKE